MFFLEAIVEASVQPRLQKLSFADTSPKAKSLLPRRKVNFGSSARTCRFWGKGIGLFGGRFTLLCYVSSNHLTCTLRRHLYRATQDTTSALHFQGIARQAASLLRVSFLNFCKMGDDTIFPKWFVMTRARKEAPCTTSEGVEISAWKTAAENRCILLLT